MRISFDFDGVVCATPFGRLAVHAPGDVPALPGNYERLYDAPLNPNILRLAIEYLRFAWRPPEDGAKAILRELAERNQLYIVTGRSAAGLSLVHRWLKRTGIAPTIADVRMAPSGLRPAQHKLATAMMLGIDAHIDDDPRTAYHLVRNGVPRVYLLDHAGAHGEEPLPAGLELVGSLREFATRIDAA